MNEHYEAQQPETKEVVELPVDDERYPGSFFRKPAPPAPGKTGWSLS